MVIAVTDRQGDILAIYQQAGAPATAAANFGVQADTNEVAVALARTASFFSNDQAPLSSRTVRYISGIHFPPGIPFTSNARAVRDREHQSRLSIQYDDFFRARLCRPRARSTAHSRALGFSPAKRI